MASSETVSKQKCGYRSGVSDIGRAAAETVECMKHILESSVFSRSPQARCFVEYVVEASLAGDSERLKAYTIGVVALGASPERSSPETTARMQASRVRRLLKRYYEGPGKDDPMEMRLPIGGYEPQFRPRFAAPIERKTTGRNFPTLYLEEFVNVTGASEDAAFCRGIFEEVGELLVRVSALRVAYSGVRECGGFDEFVLAASVSRAGESLRISCRLRTLGDGELVWSHHYDVTTKPSTILNEQDRLSKTIATQIGDPAVGAVARAYRQICHLRGLSGTQVFFRFLATPSENALNEAKEALEKELGAGQALSHACYACALCLSYCAAPATRAAELLTAEAEARKALNADSDCALGHLAKGIVHYLHREESSALRELLLAVEYEQASATTCALSGTFVALMGHWEKGLALIQDARGTEARLPQYFCLAECLYNFHERSSPSQALRVIEGLELEDTGWGDLLMACCLINLDRRADARRAAGRALKSSPQIFRRLAKHLGAVLFLPQMVRSVTEAAGEAGLTTKTERPVKSTIAPVVTQRRILPSEIRVGLLHSLTGTMAISEIHLVNAAMLAIEEINSAGGILGRPVRGVVEDGASNPRIFAEKARKLLSDDEVVGIFGCWMSSCRKAVLPVVEGLDALLWYPLQYEGLEDSRNIVYTGSCLNQQVEPAVRWAFRQNRRSCFLVGSDYVYPRTANQLIRGLAQAAGGEVIGEHYAPLGRGDFTEVAEAIAQSCPDIVYNTLNGADNITFFQALSKAGVVAQKTPVLSFSLSELELSRCGSLAMGHLACWSYFRTADTPENKDLVERFQRRYGDSAILSDPSVTAYAQMHLFKDVAERAGSIDTASLREKLAGSRLSLGGEILDVCENNHVERRASIGEVVDGGEFHIKWRSNRRIAPKPWLGAEESEPLTRGLIVQALKALPQMAEQNSGA